MRDTSYKQLKRDVSALSKEVARDSDAIRGKAQQIDGDARDTARVAQMIGAMRVDTATIAETAELGKITAGLSEAAIAYATAGDTTAKAAQAAHDQAHATHDGINEAVGRSPLGLEIYDVDREWLRQQ
ncbi:hypothetical protein AB0D12_31735 [Streptomyces sp. NPDC048479]|uniref:hypothetical protein n=1 Tax=Streptomyces sp. NPDC048479 TaxID=3154725 RepID=UPI003418E8A7